MTAHPDALTKVGDVVLAHLRAGLTDYERRFQAGFKATMAKG